MKDPRLLDRAQLGRLVGKLGDSHEHSVCDGDVAQLLSHIAAQQDELEQTADIVQDCCSIFIDKNTHITGRRIARWHVWLDRNQSTG